MFSLLTVFERLIRSSLLELEYLKAFPKASVIGL